MEHVKFPAVARNIERGLYNWNVKNFREKKIETIIGNKWENTRFKHEYKMKLLHLLCEFRRGGIVERIKSGELNLRNLTEYSADILRPDGLYATTRMKLSKKEMDREESKKRDDDYEGLLKCGKCKSLKTVYYQLQTRSADEVSLSSIISCYY